MCLLYGCGDERKKPEDTDYDILLGANGWELDKMVEIEVEHELNYLKEPRPKSNPIDIVK